MVLVGVARVAHPTLPDKVGERTNTRLVLLTRTHWRQIWAGQTTCTLLIVEIL